MKKGFTEKFRSVAGKAAATVSGVWASVYCSTTTAFASGGLPITPITVNTGVDAMTVVSKILGVIAAVFIIFGIFLVASNVFKYIEAHSEDNPAAQGKAAKGIGVGVFMIGAPVLLQTILS